MTKTGRTDNGLTVSMAAAQGKDQDFGTSTLTGNAAESKVAGSSDEAMASLKEQAKGKRVGNTVSAAFMENGQVKVYTASVNESGISPVSVRNANTAEKAVLQGNDGGRTEGEGENNYNYLNDQLGDLKDKVEIKGYHPSESVNDWWANKGYANPPYIEKAVVFVIELKEDVTFVRVYDGENSGLYGSWVMKSDDIKGLTPSQIQDKFALPTIPKYVAEVKLNAGDTLRMGEANSIFGFKGGGTQFDLMGQYIGEFNEVGSLTDWSMGDE